MERISSTQIADNIDRWLKAKLRKARRDHPTAEAADRYIRSQYWLNQPPSAEPLSVSLKNRSLRLLAVASLILGPVAPAIPDFHPNATVRVIPTDAACYTQPSLEKICREICLWCTDTHFPHPVPLPPHFN